MSPNKKTILVPSSLTIIAVFLVSLLIAFLANAGFFFTAYGYGGSTSLVNSQAKNVFVDSLVKLDNLTLTTTVVSFLIWVFVGLLVLAIIESVIKVYKNVKQDIVMTSNEYVQPAAFNKASFMTKAILDGVFLLAGFGLTVAMLLVFMRFFLPTGNEYIRMLISDTSLVSRLYKISVGTVMIFTGTLLILYVARLTIYRRRLLA